MYFMAVFFAVIALLVSMHLAREEGALRMARYRAMIHTALVFYDAPRKGETMVASLYRTHTVLGRRRRRSDISLDFLNDNRISKVHCLITYDGDKLTIKPMYRVKLFHSYFTEIFVDGHLVPPEGTVIDYRTTISIKDHIIRLRDTGMEEV